MSKPMLVTLPFVMLLLDYWPLRRVSAGRGRGLAFCACAGKMAVFLLAVISCVITYLAQRHGEAVMTLQRFPLPLRIENALISYARYL